MAAVCRQEVTGVQVLSLFVVRPLPGTVAQHLCCRSCGVSGAHVQESPCGLVSFRRPAPGAVLSNDGSGTHAARVVSLTSGTACWADACVTMSAERQEASLRAIVGYCRQRTTQELVAELGGDAVGDAAEL